MGWKWKCNMMLEKVKEHNLMYIYDKQLKPCKKSKKRLKGPKSMILRWDEGSRVLKAKRFQRILTWAASKATVLDPGTGPGRQEVGRQEEGRQQKQEQAAIKIHLLSSQAKITYWFAFNPTHGSTKPIPCKTTDVNPSTDFGDPSDDSSVVCLSLRPSRQNIFGLWTEELHKPLHFPHLSQMPDFECLKYVDVN